MSTAFRGRRREAASDDADDVAPLCVLAINDAAAVVEAVVVEVEATAATGIVVVVVVVVVVEVEVEVEVGVGVVFESVDDDAACGFALDNSEVLANLRGCKRET